MRNIFIPIIVVLAGLGGYFGFLFYQNEDIVDVWKFIPENSTCIYESNNLSTFMEALDSIALFDDIGNLNGGSYNKLGLAFLGLDKGKYDLHSLVSLHITGKNTVDLLFVLDFTNADSFQKLQNRLKESEKIRVRKYRDISINEIGDENFVLSYAYHENVLIASRTSYLVEDAIRTLLDDDQLSIKETNTELFSLPKLRNDKGNLYFNGSKTADLMNVFIKSGDEEDYFKSVFYDLNFDGSRILLNGFAYNEEGTALNDFKNQSPSEIGVFDFVPNEVSFLFHLGLSNSSAWLNKVRGEMDSLQLDRIPKWLGNEIAIYETGKEVENSKEKVLLIQTKDINEALNHINVLAEINVRDEFDSVYYELYADYEIKELQVEDFPFQAFGDSFTGFNQSYYFVLDNYLVMSNSVYALKKLLDSIEEEDTWGRSVVKSKFLESTLSEANVSLFFNVPKIWSSILKKLDDDWKKTFTAMELQNVISNGAIQFSNVDDKFYSTVVIDLVKRQSPKGSFDIEKEAYFEAELITKPFVVKNYQDHSFETLIQDSLNQIYLVDAKGDILWKDSIGESIIGGVHQIDFYKNRKLQYCFATSNYLHLVDRKGNYVKGFPKQLNSTISHFSVVDYDNSKNYRFIVEDGRGNIFTYDKQINNLKGWNPRKLENSLSEPVRHIRVRGKDYMLAVQKNGIISVMNRRGEDLKGFPLKLDVTVNSKIFLSVGSSAKTTKITLLSTEGKLITFNLEGDVINRSHIYKPSKETQFKISVGSSKKSFIIYRYDKRRLAVLDSKGEQLFEKDYLDANITNVQFYDISAGNEIYVVLDKNQNFAYIYNHQGEMVNLTPLNCSFEVGLLDYSSSMKKMIYVSYQKSLSIYSY